MVVHTWSLPAARHIVTDRGIDLWHCGQARHKSVAARLIFSAGADDERTDQAGIGSLTAWGVTQGTRSCDAIGFSIAADEIAADLKAVCHWDDWEFHVECPLESFEAAIGLMRQALLDAAFSRAEIDRLRSLRLNKIQYQRAHPLALAASKCLYQLYGPRSRFSVPLEGCPESIAALKPNDVRAWYRSSVRKSCASVVVAGGIAAQEAVRIVDRQLGGSFGGRAIAADAERREVATVTGRERGGVHVYGYPMENQAVILLGQLGVRRGHRDQAALKCLGSIMGGLFTSRLNQRLRVERGFTYAAQCRFNFRRSVGTFMVVTTVDLETVGFALRDIVAALQDIRDSGVRDDEVQLAVQHEVGLQLRAWQTPGNLADGVTSLLLDSVEGASLQRYLDELARLDHGRLSEVASQYLAPDRFSVTIVGMADQVQRKLEEQTEIAAVVAE